MDEFAGLLGMGMGNMVASAGKRHVVFLTKPAGKGVLVGGFQYSRLEYKADVYRKLVAELQALYVTVVFGEFTAVVDKGEFVETSPAAHCFGLRLRTPFPAAICFSSISCNRTLFNSQ